MKHGFTLLEVLIAMAVLVVIIGSLIPSIGWLIARSGRLRQNVQANLVMQEGVEAAYNVLQGNQSLGAGFYRLEEADGKWVLTPADNSGEMVEARFKRLIEIHQVCRDGAGKIVQNCTGGSVDQDSRLISVTVKDTLFDQPEFTSTLLVVNL